MKGRPTRARLAATRAHIVATGALTVAVAATLLAAGFGLRIALHRGGERPPGWLAVDGETMALALASVPPRRVTRSDEIRFYERRLQARGGADPLARRRLASNHLLRFQSYGRTEDMAAASEQLRWLEKSDPSDPLTAAGLASLHLSRHEFRDATEAALRALRLAGVSAETFLE